MNANELATGATGDRITTDRLMADFKVLTADMEQLFKVTANQTGDRVGQVRANVEASLQALKARIAELQEAALAQARSAGRATDTYVHANPWQIMALCAVGGLLFGAMLARGAASDA
jgi:ElaB/YqjD/DUF883 family membrane-anchored ribosome-binding protein